MIIYYLKLGFLHVIPFGFDHILFIVSLFFAHSNFKTALLQCSIFTVAHSLTLGLAAAEIVIVNSTSVEVIIALSIFVVSFNTIFPTKLKFSRFGFVFIFGLFHGLGFATVLKEIGLPKNDFFTALVSFNIGVELAQVAIITICYFCITKQLKNKTWYQQKFINPLAFTICCIALFWTMERILNS